MNKKQIRFILDTLFPKPRFSLFGSMNGYMHWLYDYNYKRCKTFVGNYPIHVPLKEVLI